MISLLLALAAALGTLLGLFVGVPVAGYLLWPVTRAVCPRLGISLGRRPHDHPVVQIEGAIAAGLGMALGVAAAVLVVGGALRVDYAATAAMRAGIVAGLIFGPLWPLGFVRRSAGLLVGVTALVAGAVAGLAG